MFGKPKLPKGVTDPSSDKEEEKPHVGIFKLKRGEGVEVKPGTESLTEGRFIVLGDQDPSTKDEFIRTGASTQLDALAKIKLEAGGGYQEEEHDVALFKGADGSVFAAVITQFNENQLNIGPLAMARPGEEITIGRSPSGEKSVVLQDASKLISRDHIKVTVPEYSSDLNAEFYVEDDYSTHEGVSVATNKGSLIKGAD